MKSLAVVRATDILKLKGTLQELDRAGVSLEGKPKEINPASVERMLSHCFISTDQKYEFCVVIPLAQDYESSQDMVRMIPACSDVVILDPSHDIFKEFEKLLPVLPDLVLPGGYYKEGTKQVKGQKDNISPVYLGVFVNRRVEIETGSGRIYEGVLKHADSIGVLFDPIDDASPLFITWHDIRKIIIPKGTRKDTQ